MWRLQDLHHARQVRELARQQADMIMAGAGMRSKSASNLAVRPPLGGHYVGDTTDFLYRPPPPLPPAAGDDSVRPASAGDAGAFQAISPGTSTAVSCQTARLAEGMVSPCGTLTTALAPVPTGCSILFCPLTLCIDAASLACFQMSWRRSWRCTLCFLGLVSPLASSTGTSPSLTTASALVPRSC